MELDTFYFIPHTHWEGAVFETRETYLEMGLPNILRALALLKADPDYRFTLDQVCYVKPFLERYPEEAAAFRRFVDEGRLGIVGGTDVMLDVNMPGGESFVRQVLYGKGFFLRALGVDVTTAWQLDAFGHHAQLPQLLKLAGFTAFWFFRGVPNWETPAEFAWEGLDGSRIPAYWLPHAYANVYGSPQTLPEFTAAMRQAYDALAPFARGRGRVGLAGADVCAPEPHVPSLVRAFNAQPDKPFHLQLAVPAEYEAAADRTDLPVLRGELNPIFQGIYSSRIALKQRTRELETLLTDAEKLGALLRAVGHAVDDAPLWQAWEPMLFNQAHDLMSGVMTDHVYEDSLRGYDLARRLAGDQVATRRRDLIACIDTRGEGIPLVVMNTLGWVRSDVVSAVVGFSDPEVRGVQIRTPDGDPVPCQLHDCLRREDGDLLQATVVFVAQDVPALGHVVYRVIPQAAETPVATVQEGAVLENALYRLQLDPATGAITQLTVKDGTWDVFAAPANVVAMEKDEGDFWELYRPLDAGSRIAMTDRHEPPPPGSAVFSTEQPAEPGTLVGGPVMSEFTVGHPFSARGEFRTTIRLYAGLRRIDIRTTIVNQDAAVRYRALFPTALAPRERVHEIPFGAIARPDAIEFPAQHWVDCGDGDRGVALLNRGLPGNNIAGGTLMLSLLRSTRIVAYGYGGGYAPGMGSDTGLELGKTLTFEYALVPHAGDWRRAAVFRDGQAFNAPLLAETAPVHAGRLPARWGLLDISHDHVVVSTLKTGHGQLVLRIYEAAGQPADNVILTFAAPLHDVEALNLLEEPVAPLPVEAHRLCLSLKPFEIITLGFNLDV